MAARYPARRSTQPAGRSRGGDYQSLRPREFAVDEEILDWKPFAYFTERSTTPAGTALFTFELTPLGDGGRTRAAMRMFPDAGAEGIRAIEPMVPTLRDWSRHSGEALAKLLASVSHE